MKSKTKVSILFALVIIFLIFSIFNNRFSKIYLEYNENNQVQIKQSGFWNLTGSPIFINASATGVGAHNWTWAETQSWCSGSGSWTDPYVIENVTIDGQGSGNCIEIWNSDAYLIIRNCSLYNSGTSYDNYGIKLNYVNNGKIINSNCSNNNRGIYLGDCNNNTLSGNTANYNIWYGIILLYSDNNTLSGNTAINNQHYGIYLIYSDNNTLSGNTASNSYYYGIYIDDSNNNTLSGNTASNNNAHGIYLEDSNNNALSGNLMNFCGIFLKGSLAEMTSQCIDDTNLVNNKPIYYYINELGLGSSNFTNAGQIILINCTNSIISGLNISDGSGIYLYYSNNNTLSGNTACNNHNYGMYLLNSDNNTLLENTVNNNNNGIELTSSNNNTLSGNTASNNYNGIYLRESNNNTLTGNTANNNIDGIGLWDSNNNMLLGNTVNNNNNGIDLIFSNNNTLSGNTASTNNAHGIYLEDSNNNALSGNLMNFCGIFLKGSLAEMVSHSIDITNLVNNKSVYYYANELGLGSSNFTNAGQIILINCNNSIISGLNISDGSGISLYYCGNNTLSGNNASYSSRWGIFLGFSNNITLSGNTVKYNNEYGIYLRESNNNTLLGNTANNNYDHGIYLRESNNNTLLGNTANNNYDHGIYLEYSNNNNTLLGNIASNNYDHGIYLWYSNNNTLSGNTVNNNNDYGLYFYFTNNTDVIGNVLNNNRISWLFEDTCIGNVFSWNVIDELADPIIIDNFGSGNFTWSEAANQLAWVQGKGTWLEPYIIENITINGQNSSSCLEIRNSNAYFIIRSCSFSNSDPNPWNAGIKLTHINNGKIINTVSKNNFGGMYLDSSTNNTFSVNNASNNIYFGIYLNNSNDNMLSGNIISNNGWGIRLDSSNNNTLSGNTANNNNGGIDLKYSNNNTLLGNIASNNIYDGIDFRYSDNNKLTGNTANNNNDYGIYLLASNNNSLSGNLMNYCGIYLYGSFAELASHSIDNTNLVNNKPVYYYVNKRGLGSSNFTNAGQIILINCNNSIIIGLNLSNGTMGMYLGYSNNNTLIGNIANNNLIGIYLFYSDNNTLTGNIANNNGIGIILFGSNNTISGNTASSNYQSGIYIGVSNNNKLSGNTLSNNTYGIYLDSDSNDNKIFLNYFLNCTINAHDNGINNKWDNGFIGNYWSDYAGVDANDDGIGDTPYLVPGTAGSQDNFPIYDNIAPVITLIFPLPDGVFGLDAPNYIISIDELILDTIWYTLDGGIMNYTITGLIGTLNQAPWEALSDGIYTIRFYANDTTGNIGFAAVTVEKDITAPIITIIVPLPDGVFGLDAPNYNISIDELNLDTIWYTLDGGGTNYTITSLTGTFNQTAWGALNEGSLTIRFYANDTAGNIGFKDVEVIIEIPKGPDNPIISFGNYYILFTAIAILSFIILEKHKKK